MHHSRHSIYSICNITLHKQALDMTDGRKEIRCRLAPAEKLDFELTCLSLGKSQNDAAREAILEYVARHKPLVDERIRRVETTDMAVSKNETIASLLHEEKNRRGTWRRIATDAGLQTSRVRQLAAGEYPINEELIALSSVLTRDAKQISTSELKIIRDSTFPQEMPSRTNQRT
mgnify:CR=1 FL=1